MSASGARPRRIEIVAQDPSVVTSAGRVVTAVVTLPAEDLDDGPMGCSIYIMDYDASTGRMYRPAEPRDWFDIKLPATRAALLNDPEYQAWNAYAIVHSTLQRFEFALGRRVGWGIRGHQLKVVPHAFEDSNAFYSPDAEALLFGYVRGAAGAEPTLLCLSHDVVVHETAHALLDGLRAKFMSPSSTDQAALHEAFADIVALLSVFAQPEVVSHLLCPIAAEDADTPAGLVRRSALTWERLRDSALFGLADNMRGGNGIRADALRRSVAIEPDPGILSRAEYLEEHRRGEVLVGAVMRSFLSAWVERIAGSGEQDPDAVLDVGVVAESGADIADVLLTMCIRAIDYTPPIHIAFGDFLSAMLTADHQVRNDDSRYRLRDHLLTEMSRYGIEPASTARDGCWCSPDLKLVKDGTHFASLQTDTTEMFRHVWNNKEALRLNPHAFTRITSVRPCLRVSPDDGFQVRETVVECGQYLKLTVPELISYGLKPPKGMSPDTQIELEGGSTLILDEYGELKFEVSNSLPSPPAVHDTPQRRRALLRRWQRRIDYLWQRGYLDAGTNRSRDLPHLHRLRAQCGSLTTEAQRIIDARRRAERWC